MIQNRFLLLPLSLIVAWLAMMRLGTGGLDRVLLGTLYSADHPVLKSAAMAVTMAGEWQSLVLLVVAVAAWLFLVGRNRTALAFLGVTLVGRLLVHIQKITIGRVRPEEIDHLVAVNSPSFPSGHASNSMLVFLSMALIAAPERHRRLATALALAGTFVVGISRPMLGVHWPSDVIAGWSFGAAWVVLSARVLHNRKFA